MKRIALLAFIASIFVSLTVSGQNPTPTPAPTDQGSTVQEKVLIDFAKLDDSAVSSEVKFSKWNIHLSGLSDNPTSRRLSDLKMVTVAADQINKDAGESFAKCFGIRINFAEGYNNDWAQIKTEDPLSGFRLKGTEGMGLLENVGPVKSVSLMVRGMNYMHSIEIRMLDQDGKYRSVNFGGLYFNSWKRLTWESPDFINDKRKRDLIKIHLYPTEKPQLKFDSIVIYKAPNEKGGDFVCYIKDVKVAYEPYFTREVNDIDNEGVWGIQKSRDDAKKSQEDQMRFLKYSGSSMEEEYIKERDAGK
jgi:hypothetical protein